MTDPRQVLRFVMSAANRLTQDLVLSEHADRLDSREGAAVVASRSTKEDAVSDNVFESRRVVRAYRQTIEAPPDVVFPLLCPVREADWLDGWAYTMVYSASGLVEDGAVFTTAHPGEEDTVWIVTRHDRGAGLVEFTRFTPGSRTCVLRIAVSQYGDARSYVDVSYAYTSIARSGNEFLGEWTENAFLAAVVFWEKSMNHFLKTGDRLSRAAAAPTDSRLGDRT